MESEKHVCPQCGEEFDPNHGNRIYCSYQCYDKFKHIKQKKNNAIVKQFRKGLLANYRRFRQLHSGTGVFKFPLWELLKYGFDQNAFYGTVRNKEKEEWRRLNEYYFRIVDINGQPYLLLYKA